MGADLHALLGRTMALMRVHGLGLYIDYLAVTLLLSTFGALADPEGLRARLSGAQTTPPTGMIEAVVSSPATYSSSIAFSLVTAIAFLRVWQAEQGSPTPQDARLLLRLNLGPLILLQIVADIAFTLSLFALFLPAMVVASLTMFLTPAVLLEDRGFGGLGRAASMALPRLLPLCVGWLAIILPWVITVVLSNPVDPALAQAGPIDLWLIDLVANAFAPIFSVISLCFVIAAYQRYGDPGGRDLHDTFR